MAAVAKNRYRSRLKHNQDKTMTKKAIISILFLLLLTALACTSADYAAAFHVEYEGEELPSSSSSTLSAEEQSEATMLTAGVPSTALPAMRVCTGAKKGTLRVRDNAGTDQAVKIQNRCL